MGAWGKGSFENDEARNWLGRLAEQGLGPDTVRAALSRIEEGPRASSRECCVALAAAELAAGAAGRAHPKMPAAAAKWLAENVGWLLEEDVALAQLVVLRIDQASELQELWDEGERSEAWHDAVRDLMGRLSRL